LSTGSEYERAGELTLNWIWKGWEQPLRKVVEDCHHSSGCEVLGILVVLFNPESGREFQFMALKIAA
jgi:hypothetical protein